MEKDSLITAMDLLLSRHKGLLEPAEEIEYVNLLAEAREAPEDEEGNVPEIPLRLAVLNKKLELLVRDSSDEVNGFTIGGQTLWINKYDRANLRNAIEALEDVAEETVKFKGVTIPVSSAKAMLAMIEVYAAKCAEKTADHAAAIEELGSIADVNRYDITVGYPEKLEF